MKLIIDIPEEDYKRVCTIVDMGLGTNVDEAIKNGTPLPKGHGRLIDEDALEFRNVTVLYDYDWECGENTYADVEVVRADDVWNTPTIIEADKGDRE